MHRIYYLTLDAVQDMVLKELYLGEIFFSFHNENIYICIREKMILRAFLRYFVLWAGESLTLGVASPCFEEFRLHSELTIRFSEVKRWFPWYASTRKGLRYTDVL